MKCKLLVIPCHHLILSLALSLWYCSSLYRCLPLVIDALVLSPSVTGYWRCVTSFGTCHWFSLSLVTGNIGAVHHIRCQRDMHTIRGVSMFISRASVEAPCLSRSDRSQGWWSYPHLFWVFNNSIWTTTTIVYNRTRNTIYYNLIHSTINLWPKV